MTAQDLKELKIIDHIIEEPVGGAQKDPEKVAAKMKEYIIERLNYYSKFDGEEIKNHRYEKFRNIGKYF